MICKKCNQEVTFINQDGICLTCISVSINEPIIKELTSAMEEFLLLSGDHQFSYIDYLREKYRRILDGIR